MEPAFEHSKAHFSSACGAKHGARGERRHGVFCREGLRASKNLPLKRLSGVSRERRFLPQTPQPKSPPYLRASVSSVFGAAGPFPKRPGPACPPASSTAPRGTAPLPYPIYLLVGIATRTRKKRLEGAACRRALTDGVREKMSVARLDATPSGVSLYRYIHHARSA